MSNLYARFLEESKTAAFDTDHHSRMEQIIKKHHEMVLAGEEHWQNLCLGKKRAANTKHKITNNLDKWLAEFEKNFSKNGGKIIWAPTEKDAQREILQILKKTKAQIIVNQKSIVSDELDINEMLVRTKREVRDTDLDDYIRHLSGEKSSYNYASPEFSFGENSPSFLREKLGLDHSATQKQLTNTICEQLKCNYSGADIAITGANFLLANPGAIVLSENEGNGLLGASSASIHIVIAGIEKLLPSFEDLEIFLPLLAQHKTGQHLHTYNSIITSPRTEEEPDGPDEMFVILLDNHRTEILNYKEQRRALHCIQCSACLYACPVYRNIGSHAYNSTYTGPIGAIISPILKGFKDYNHLSHASTLCGRCTEVCPIGVPLHTLLLENKQESVKNQTIPTISGKMVQYWTRIMLRRWLLDRIRPGIKNRMVRHFLGRQWNQERNIPKIAKKSFREWYLENRTDH